MIRAALVALSLSLLACGDVGAVDVSSGLSSWIEQSDGTLRPRTDGLQLLGSTNYRPAAVYTLGIYLPSGVAGVELRNISSGNRIVQHGSCTFNGAATATCTKAVAYFDSLSYVCTATKYGAVTTVGTVNTSGTVVTVTSGLANDTGVVTVICVGN
jgi:hypothetical protein